VEAFASVLSIEQIVVVTDEKRFSSLDTRDLSTDVLFAKGGDERQDSVVSGMLALSENTKWVAIHDGARPLIHPEQIERVFEFAQKYQAATSARPVTETLKRADKESFSKEAVSRENLWIMETPQVFSKEVLIKAYDFVRNEGLFVTDEVSAVEAVGYVTKLVKNPNLNPKLTYPEDFELAKMLLKNRDES